MLVDDDPAVLAAVKAGNVLASRVSNPYMLAYLAADALKLATNGCTWNGDFIYPNNYQTITADKVDTIGAGPGHGREGAGQDLDHRLVLPLADR